MIRCAESLRVMRFYGRIGSGQLVDILAKQRRKRLQATLLKSVDEGFDGRHCLAEIVPGSFDAGYQRLGKRRMQADEKIIRRLAGYTVRSKVSRRKVPEIPSDDKGGFPSDGGCQNVPVVRVG